MSRSPRALSLSPPILLLTIGLVAVGLIVTPLLDAFESKRSSPGPVRGMEPSVMLWAWETPTDLRWLDPSRAGVAFLAATVLLEGEESIIKPRMQPLIVPPTTFLEAVIRVETSKSSPATLTSKQADRIAALVKRQTIRPGIRAVQIDFDATRSQRQFYLRVLSQAREELPVNINLSMTSLASWCIGDNWLSDARADQVIPMFFRMGADHDVVLSHLRHGRRLVAGDKRLAIGLSVDEKDVVSVFTGRRIAGRRLYLFSPPGWSERKLERMLKEMGR